MTACEHPACKGKKGKEEELVYERGGKLLCRKHAIEYDGEKK